MTSAAESMVVDILVPFWGDPRLLKETVESVLAQTSDQWTLTVVDDAYPDPSVAEYLTAIEDPRVRYIRNETNKGITENYRVCLNLATAPLIVFLGCDDLLHPNYVDVILTTHDRYPRAAIIQPGVLVIDENGAPVLPLVDRVKRWLRPRTEVAVQLEAEELAVSLLRGNWLYWPSLAFRSDVVRAHEFLDGLPIIQDLALIMDMVYAGESLVFEPTVCCSYRRHSTSASASTLLDGSRFDGERTYFRIAAEQARDLGWSKAERAARRRLLSRAHALSVLPSTLRPNKLSAARYLLAHAFGR